MHNEYGKGLEAWAQAEFPDTYSRLIEVQGRLNALEAERSRLKESLPADFRRAAQTGGPICDKPYAYLEAKETGRPVADILAERRKATTPGRPPESP